MTNKKTKKILVVEDEKPMARALELKLSHAGFEVKNAFDGEQALEMLKKESFDLVLLDLVMPKKDGFEVLEGINANKIKTNIIVTSNLGQAEDLKRAKEMGAKDYFIKSDTPISNIVDYINKALK